MNASIARANVWLLACAAAAGLLLALALGMACGVQHAYAGGASLDVLKAKNAGTMYAKKSDLGWESYWATDHLSEPITDVSSSNTNVAEVKVGIPLDGTRGCLAVNAKKKGSTIIRFTHAGKSYQVKYTVMKFANPVKQLKIGNKNFAKKVRCIGRDTCQASTTAKALSGRLRIKPSKGWKVTGKMYATGSNGWKRVKNGSNIKDLSLLSIAMKHKKTGTIVRLFLQVTNRVKNTKATTASTSAGKLMAVSF